MTADFPARRRAPHTRAHARFPGALGSLTEAAPRPPALGEVSRGEARGAWGWRASAAWTAAKGGARCHRRRATHRCPGQPWYPEVTPSQAAADELNSIASRHPCQAHAKARPCFGPAARPVAELRAGGNAPANAACKRSQGAPRRCSRREAAAAGPGWLRACAEQAKAAHSEAARARCPRYRCGVAARPAARVGERASRQASGALDRSSAFGVTVYSSACARQHFNPCEQCASGGRPRASAAPRARWAAAGGLLPSCSDADVHAVLFA